MQVKPKLLIYKKNVLKRFEILIQTYILYTYLNLVLHNKQGQIHHSDSKLKYHGMTCAWNHTQIANKISLKLESSVSNQQCKPIKCQLEIYILCQD